MKIVTTQQMREEERLAQENYGISPLILMENASLSIADIIIEYYGNLENVAIVCGSGNNGGDGYALARHLKNAGFNVSVIMLSLPKTDEALANCRIAQEIADTVCSFGENPNLADTIFKDCDFIVDAIFGTGLDREVTGIYRDAILKINSAQKPVVAIDIPSGINADNGQVMGVCAEADLTVALGYAKCGHFLYPGREKCADVAVGYISLPETNSPSGYELIDNNYVSGIIPERTPSSHKGNYGKVLIVGGSAGLTGAPCLAATGALKSGAGLVTVACGKSINPILETKLTEAMTLPLSEDNTTISADAFETIYRHSQQSSVILFGCGIGRSPSVTELLRKIITNVNIPVIIDADGLFALAQDIDILKFKTCPVIITPHYMEMSRLTDLNVNEVASDVIGVAKNFASKYSLTVVLKGATTVIADEDMNIYINTTGNNGMSTGGSGDLLAGVTASMVAQGALPADAAAIASFVCGKAADLAVQNIGEHALLPTDTAENLGKVFISLTE